MATGDTLRSHHLAVSIPCVFCNEVDETMDHIFRDCHYFRAVWFEGPIPVIFNSNGVGSMIDWLQDVCNGLDFKNEDNTRILKWIITFLESIWEARNKRY